MHPNTQIFTVVFIVAILIFLFSCYRRISFAALGRRGVKRTDHVGHRLLGVLKYGFAQKRIVQKPYGFNHLFLFWSFIILLAANLEFVLKGLNPAISFMALPPAVYNVIYCIFDIFSLVALVTVVIALIRRFVAPPYPKSRTVDAFVVLILIAILMVAYFSLHGIEIEQGLIVVNMPVSAFVGHTFYAGLSTDAAASAMLGWWWTHAITFLFFLNYLPYSKHIHILTALFNMFFKSDDYKELLPKETFEKDAQLGAGRIDEFTWKDLFDSYSCAECGRCQMNCPAYLTGKDLNPRLMMHALKLNLNENGSALKHGDDCRVPLFSDNGLPDAIDPKVLWQCTTCGKCMTVCPTLIEQVPKIIEMRRYQVEMKSDFPEELLHLFGNVEQRSNPWGIAPTERTKWYSKLDVKEFDESCEYLFYVGCAGSFDDRNKQTAIALARILDAAGVSWGVLGKDEPCCGESLRQLGNEYLFNQMATANVALFKERGVKKIITFCPHCYAKLDIDYRREFGLDAEVIHHTEFIKRLIDEGRLHLRTDIDDERIVYHDSCVLGRYCGMYDTPRELVAQVSGALPAEMERNRERSFCCGAGGGQMWLEETEGTRVNIERTSEALRENPDTICVNCPYCMTMFEDGLKETDSGAVVKDVAELVAERLT